MSGINMILLASGQGVPPTPVGLTWVSRNADVGGLRIWGVASSGSLRVAIGNTVVTRSVSGTTGWTNTGTPLPAPLDNGRGIVWFNNLFIVAGFTNSFNGVIATSPDGITWTVVLSGVVVSQILSISVAGDLVIATGVNGTIYTSTNGTSWTPRTSGTALTLRGATKANSTYVIVGNTGKILTSSDGVSWTNQNSGVSENLTAVTWAGSQFVAVGGNGQVLKSFTGEFWSGPQIGPGGAFGTLGAVAFSGNEIIAVGPIQTSQARVYRSTDAFNTWSTITPSTAYGGIFQSIIWDSFQFIAVGDTGALFTSNS
jgi:flagellin